MSRIASIRSADISSSLQKRLYKEEHIFEDYYLSDNVYFRLKQAYLAYVSREYIVYGRNLEKCVFEIIANECEE